ncbi:MAG: hypothetical protein Q8N05_07695, partial [Bacteroidota bacterium]|nr:hypothetical protein [Bacteroidota bacterium]
MILQRIGSLKVVSNLNRFQRRLESPAPPNHACHSREGGNLRQHILPGRINERGNVHNPQKMFVIPAKAGTKEPYRALK